VSLFGNPPDQNKNRLFKNLTTVLFVEFLELFAPQIAIELNDTSDSDKDLREGIRRDGLVYTAPSIFAKCLLRVSRQQQKQGANARQNSR